MSCPLPEDMRCPLIRVGCAECLVLAQGIAWALFGWLWLFGGKGPGL
jgi:hypothetical protein